jgi:hypothetical protein
MEETNEVGRNPIAGTSTEERTTKKGDSTLEAQICIGGKTK